MSQSPDCPGRKDEAAAKPVPAPNREWEGFKGQVAESIALKERGLGRAGWKSGTPGQPSEHHSQVSLLRKGLQLSYSVDQGPVWMRPQCRHCPEQNHPFGILF